MDQSWRGRVIVSGWHDRPCRGKFIVPSRATLVMRGVRQLTMHPRDQRARDIQHRIGAILHRAWDPISVNDEPLARDEYAPYVAGVYRLLASGSSPDRLAEHLSRIETEQMGLDTPNPQRLIPVVEELLRLDIRLEPPGAPDAAGGTL